MLPYELFSFLVNFTIPTSFSLLALSWVFCSLSVPTSCPSLSKVMVFAAISSKVLLCSSEQSIWVIKFNVSISCSCVKYSYSGRTGWFSLCPYSSEYYVLFSLRFLLEIRFFVNRGSCSLNPLSRFVLASLFGKLIRLYRP